MITTVIGIGLMVGLSALAVFSVCREIRKDSKIKADKQKYKADVEKYRAQFTEEELDEMSRKYDKQAVISNLLSILPF
ncbi:MAG: hypothetical protein J5956_05120 [Ruminococcus sp.]|nr:hypothetical protein [Ruminococcus sp.]